MSFLTVLLERGQNFIQFSGGFFQLVLSEFGRGRPFFWLIGLGDFLKGCGGSLDVGFGGFGDGIGAFGEGALLCFLGDFLELRGAHGRPRGEFFQLIEPFAVHGFGIAELACFFTGLALLVP